MFEDEEALRWLLRERLLEEDVIRGFLRSFTRGSRSTSILPVIISEKDRMLDIHSVAKNLGSSLCSSHMNMSRVIDP